MSTGSERLVGRLGALADGTVPIVDLVTSIVLSQGLASDTLLVDPSMRVPDRRILPDLGVHLSDTGGSEDKVAFRDDVGGVLLGDSRGGDRSWNRDVGHDLAHDRVDRGVLRNPDQYRTVEVPRERSELTILRVSLMHESSRGRSFKSS
jgi:hypothetical protein